MYDHDSMTASNPNIVDYLRGVAKAVSSPATPQLPISFTRAGQYWIMWVLVIIITHGYREIAASWCYYQKRAWVRQQHPAPATIYPLTIRNYLQQDLLWFQFWYLLYITLNPFMFMFCLVFISLKIFILLSIIFLQLQPTTVQPWIVNTEIRLISSPTRQDLVNTKDNRMGH